MKRLPEADRLAELERRSAPGSWEQRLASDVRAARDDEAAVAIANEALADVEHALTERAAWPGAGIRIAALSGLLLAATAYVESRQPKWSLAIAGLAGVSVLSCVEAGRAARRSAEAQRAAVDALVAAALGRLAAAPPAAQSSSRAGRSAASERRSARRRSAGA